MDIAEIRKLIRVMRDHGILELEVQDRRGKIRLVRENGARADAAPRGGAARESAGRAEVVVAAPMGGTFHRGPGPHGPRRARRCSAARPGGPDEDSSRTPSHRTEFWDRSDACFAGC